MGSTRSGFSVVLGAIALGAVAALGVGASQVPPPPPPPPAIGIQIPATSTVQTPTTAQKGTGLILGQVLDAGTGKPVSGAVVSLTGIRSAASIEAARMAEMAAVGLTPFIPEETAAPGATGPVVPSRVMTDGEGRFVFRELAAGRYNFTATAPGYIAGTYGQRRPAGPGVAFELADGEKQRDATFRMWKSASISGTVLDEAGEPVVAVSVRSLRRTFTGGGRRWAPGLSATTDDRGAYRLANLMPGDYAVAVLSTQTTLPTSTVDAYMQAIRSGSSTASLELSREFSTSGAPYPSSSGFHVGDFVLSSSGIGGRNLMPPAPSDEGKVLVYQNVYFPSATSLSQATMLTLTSGEERSGLDLQLRLVPTVRVSGSVTGPDGPVKNIGVRLMPEGTDEFASESGLEVVSTATDPAGAFTFLGVPSGQYTLKVLKVPRPTTPISMSTESTMIGAAGGSIMFGMSTPPSPGTLPPPPPLPTDPTLWAAMAVAVSETDVAGLSVTLRSGARVTGRVEFEGQKQKPTAEQMQRMSVTLAPLDTRPVNIVTAGRVGADGQFTTLGYPPGRYLVSAGSANPNWTFKSAVHGGRDVSDEPLEITGGDVGGIVLVFTDQPTDLSGTVTNARGQADADADVIVFPANHQLWKDYGVSARRSRSIRTSKIGVYQIPNLPPGEYYLAAVGSTTTGDWQDPKFLEAVIKIATRITLAAGEKRSQDLKTGQIR